MQEPTTGNFQLKFMFGAKIPVDLGENTMAWRQGVRSASVELKTITGFGLRQMPKVLNAPSSELIIVAVKGTTQTRYRIPVVPDDAETLRLIAAMDARLPGKNAASMAPEAAAAIIPPPGAGSDWLTTRVVIGVMLIGASAMTGVIGRAAGGGGSSAFEAGQRVGYMGAVLAGVVAGVFLVFSGLRRAKKARLAREGKPDGR